MNCRREPYIIVRLSSTPNINLKLNRKLFNLRGIIVQFKQSGGFIKRRQIYNTKFKVLLLVIIIGENA